MRWGWMGNKSFLELVQGHLYQNEPRANKFKQHGELNISGSKVKWWSDLWDLFTEVLNTFVLVTVHKQVCADQNVRGSLCYVIDGTSVSINTSIAANISKHQQIHAAEQLNATKTINRYHETCILWMSSFDTNRKIHRHMEYVTRNDFCCR